MLDQLEKLCLSYFLNQYPPRSGRRRTKDIIKQFLLKDFSVERVDEFIEERLGKLQRSLVEEFNVRFSSGRPLRFQIVDRTGIGTLVQGYQVRKSATELAFQDSLNRLSPRDFEKLAPLLLRQIGCTEVYFTPHSHDQGVDAFGYQEVMKPTPYGVVHHLTWVAQAKHYRSSSVTTGDIRELVGSCELLIAKAFSTVDERYAQLRLRSYAPIALALITTEEVPNSVRRLAENAGVYVFAASDIFFLLGQNLARLSPDRIKRLLSRQKIAELA